VSSVPIPRIRKSSFPKAGIGLPPCCSFWRLQVATTLNREEIRNDDRMILFFHGGMQPRTGLRIRLDSLAMEFGPPNLTNPIDPPSYFFFRSPVITPELDS
jgi:hypothetical protein